MKKTTPKLYTGFRENERIYRHVCDESKAAGAQRNHRNESRVMLGPFGLGVLNMDIDADWAGDQKNKSIYLPGATCCPYCGIDIANLLKQANEAARHASTLPH